MNKTCWLCILLCCPLLLAACGLPSGTLSDLYKENLSDVSEISIVDGRTGEKTNIADARTIEAFLKDMEGVTFTPLQDQSAREGYIYSVHLFEDGDETFSFTSNTIGEHYYASEPDFHPIVEGYTK
ncbi:hypothetical protein [Planococcus chinensis]|uniref:DUF4825 domain-containing protein n=1 Tax=Planococcus chinensis TaxID=272917 RepID=A0ABW4QDA9_9BACL